MASVFLSYDREDADRARPIAAALEKAGHSVWWDRHIKGGAQYSKEIDLALKAADAVVVLWSERSVESAWVRDEAAAGRDSGRLVPVSLDETEPPLGFRQYQTIDLSGWTGRGRPRLLQAMLEAVEALGNKGRGFEAAEPVRVAAPPDQSSTGLRVNPWLIFAAALAILALLIARPWEVRASVPTVAVAAADRSAGSNGLARDLLVQLGNYQASRPGNVELMDAEASGLPDLIIEVSGSPAGSRPSANLTLLRGRDRMVLTSQEIVGEPNGANDLGKSLAASAARLLGCATDALQARPPLPRDDLKLYLGACGRFAGLYGSDDISLILPQLEQVTERNPGFLPVWRQLLLAGASLQAIPSDEPKPPPDSLQKQVAAARRIDPAMPEVQIAELELLPATDFEGRFRLIDRLAEREPENPIVLVTRASQLLLVGRMKEAVDDAERAAMLDPMCVYCRHAYIQALAYSGRVPRALQEIQKAAPLVLGAKNLIEADFRINMRYGDPRHALQLLRSYGTSKPHEVFLLARIEPTEVNVDRAIAASVAESSDVGFFARHAEILATFGRNDQIYDMLMRLPPDRIEGGVISAVFRPIIRDFRQDARFLKVAKRFGLLDYWRNSGKWPDFCFDPTLPYDCKAEAAKLG
jgi:hypothetical protein